MLPPDIMQAFASRRLLYAAKSQKSILQFWFNTTDPDDDQLRDPPGDCPFVFSRQGERIVRFHSAPALHKPMFSNRLAWGNFLFFARYMAGRRDFPIFADGTEVSDELLDAVKAVADKLERPIQWQKNDLLMLDNTRFMHGRRQIAKEDERLIMSYFGYLNFAIPSEEEPPNAKWRDPMAWNLEL